MNKHRHINLNLCVINKEPINFANHCLLKKNNKSASPFIMNIQCNWEGKSSQWKEVIQKNNRYYDSVDIKVTNDTSPDAVRFLRIELRHISRESSLLRGWRLEGNFRKIDNLCLNWMTREGTIWFKCSWHSHARSMLFKNSITRYLKI